MPDTGVTSNDPVPTLEDVGQEFPERRSAPGWLHMSGEIAVSLAASLHAAAADMSGIANGMAGISTDDEIEQQAKMVKHRDRRSGSDREP